MKRLVAAVILILYSATGYARQTDTMLHEQSIPETRRQAKPISYRSFLLPAGLIGYGVLSLHAPALQDINEDIHDLSSAGPYTFTRPYLEDYLLLAPALTVYGLNIFGVKGRNTVADATMIYAMSNLVSYGVSYSVKQFSNETRPDGSDDQSFPSGHTTGAFVAAEFLNQEYRGKVHWSVIAGGYLAAGSVAYLRMYHNKHWFGDVVAGAGIGMAGTRFCYFLYPHLKRWISGGRENKSQVMLLPTFSPGGIYGLAFVKRI